MSSELFDRLLRATLAVYRVCECIPGDEPFARMIKKATLRFAASFVMSLHAHEGYNRRGSAISLEILCAYFLIARQVAKRHQWLDPENFAILEREYRALQKHLDQLHPAPKEDAVTRRHIRRTRLEKESVARYGAYAPQRHSELGSYIQSMQNEKFSLKDITEKFPTISPRTVRRHLQEMVRKGTLQKDGDRRTTLYYLSLGLETD